MKTLALTFLFPLLLSSCLLEETVNSRKSITDESVTSGGGEPTVESRAYCALFGANDYLIFSYRVDGEANSKSPTVTILDTLTFSCDTTSVSQNTAQANAQIANYLTFSSFGETDIDRLTTLRDRLINAARTAPLQGPGHLGCVERLIDTVFLSDLEGQPDSCLTLVKTRL